MNQKEKTRRKQHPQLLCRADRESLVAAIDQIGFHAVTTEVMRLDPYRERNSASALLRNVYSDAGHSFSSSSLNLLEGLAEVCRAARPAPAPPSAATDTRGHAELSQQAVSAIVASVMQALGQTAKPTVDAPAKAPPLPPQVIALLPERVQIKQFTDLDESSQLNILHSMHSRYGDSLREQGLTSGEHRAAWRISYDAYDKETGANCQGRATVEADTTGVRVKPVEIIRRDGDLLRFYEIVRKTWQR